MGIPALTRSPAVIEASRLAPMTTTLRGRCGSRPMSPRASSARPRDAITITRSPAWMSVSPRATTVSPRGRGYHYALGKLLEDLGRDADALAAYRRELILDPTQPQARKRVTQLERRVGAVRR